MFEKIKLMATRIKFTVFRNSNAQLLEFVTGISVNVIINFVPGFKPVHLKNHIYRTFSQSTSMSFSTHFVQVSPSVMRIGYSPAYGWLFPTTSISKISIGTLPFQNRISDNCNFLSLQSRISRKSISTVARRPQKERNYYFVIFGSICHASKKLKSEFWQYFFCSKNHW